MENNITKQELEDENMKSDLSFSIKFSDNNYNRRKKEK